MTTFTKQEYKCLALWGNDISLSEREFAQMYGFTQGMAERMKRVYLVQRNELNRNNPSKRDFLYFCSGLEILEKAIKHSSFVRIEDRRELTALAQKLSKEFYNLQNQMHEFNREKENRNADIRIVETAYWRNDAGHGDS